MLSFIIGALKVIILLGTLITIHEFGHFIVAKLCNMKVLKFSIGFGHKIFYKKIGETEYSIRLLPLGGFVQLEGEDEESNDARSFSKSPVWQRILVLLAGITMNFLLAIFIYLCIYMNINLYTTTKIGADTDPNLITMFGLNVGDEIYKVNGKKVLNGEDVDRIIETSDSDIFTFIIIDQNDKAYEKTIEINKKSIGYVGVVFENTNIYQLVEGQAGEKAGLKVGDKILSMNNESGDIYHYLDIISANPHNEIKMVVEREGENVDISLVPNELQKRKFNVKFIEVQGLDFVHNFINAIKETKYYLKLNFIGIGDLIKGKTENVEVQGIVGISNTISKTQSFIEFFYLMSAISLSLAIMNLLPIPGLDGGKLIFVIVEVVTGKPVSKETEAKITLVGLMILIGLMIMITYMDVSKL